MLKLSKKPTICLESADSYHNVVCEDRTIRKSLFANIENCAEVTKVTIPSNVEGVELDAFVDFVNLREAEILGSVEGVEYLLGTTTLDIDWKNPAELAEHLKRGRYISVERTRSWSNWN